MNCPRCGKENDPSNEFCGKCGLRFADVAAPTASADEVVYCFKHKREATNLRCGRCDRPICTRCVVMSPAGVRCTECARHNVAFRPMAVLHNFQLGLSRLFRSGSPWMWFIVISMLLSTVRGCMYLNQRHDRVPVERSVPIEE
jgi:hypothetical protein